MPNAQLQEVSLQRIAITGASEYFGSHVVPDLLSKGSGVTALVRSPESASKVETFGCQAGLYDLEQSVARFSATLAEATWTFLRISGWPPITKPLVDLIGGEFRIDDTRARQELGCHNRIPIDCPRS